MLRGARNVHPNTLGSQLFERMAYMATIFKDNNFDILFTCQLLGLPVRTDKRNYYIDCPWCSQEIDERGRAKGKDKLNINIDINAWHCNRCDRGGYAMQLYAQMKGITNSDACREIGRAINGDVQKFEGFQKEVEQKKRNLPVEAEGAPKEIRYAAYSAFLDELTLNEEHRIALINRGLSLENIEHNKYRSVPKNPATVVTALLKKGVVLDGVPGFYPDGKGGYKLGYSGKGYYIPVRSYSGNIEAMQIRQDNPKDGAKYIWLSSGNKEGGCSVNQSINQIHYTNFASLGKRGIKEICLTEGPLKADVAASLLDVPFLAVVGVNNRSQLAKNLKGLKSRTGIDTVRLCFDMDRLTNEHVAKAVEKIIALVNDIGFERVYMQKWNPEFKGIDDYALSVAKTIFIEK